MSCSRAPRRLEDSSPDSSSDDDIPLASCHRPVKGKVSSKNKCRNPITVSVPLAQPPPLPQFPNQAVTSGTGATIEHSSSTNYNQQQPSVTLQSTATSAQLPPLPQFPIQADTSGTGATIERSFCMNYSQQQPSVTSDSNVTSPTSLEQTPLSLDTPRPSAVVATREQTGVTPNTTTPSHSRISVTTGHVTGIFMLRCIIVT